MVRGRTIFLVAMAFGAPLLVQCGRDESFTNAGVDGGVSDGADGTPGDAAAADAARQETSSASTCAARIGYPQAGCDSGPTCEKFKLTSAQDAFDKYPFGIAVDQAHVYWVAQDDRNGGGSGYVNRTLKVPAAAPVVERVSPLLAEPEKLALDDGHVYVGHREGTEHRVTKLAKTCGGLCAPTTVFAGPWKPTRILVLGGATGAVFVLTPAVVIASFPDGGAYTQTNVRPSTDYSSLEADDRHAFWGSSPGMAMHKLSLDGRSDTFFAPFPGDAGGTVLHADCTSVFVRAAHKTWRISQADPSQVVLLADTPGNLYGHAADAEYVYLAFADGGGIWRVRKNAPAPAEQIVSGDIWTVTADDSFGYYGDHASGDITRWAK